MHFQTTTMTIARFCEDLKNNAIIINHEYQRQAGVWPKDAQSFLIETILLRFPLPKLSIYEHTDVTSRRTTSEIVDGQQRAMAILAFSEGKITLSRTLEFEDIRGRTYNQLPTELQERFLSYPLGIDLLVDTTSADIREIFRRINSYEVPLNYEEQRHARHQGPFKWFIYHLARDYGERLKALGTFNDRNLIRMADMKFLADISFALVYEIKTTAKRDLDKIYKDFDHAFPEEDQVGRYIRQALDKVISLDFLYGSQLIKQFSLQSLVLALIHARHDVPSLRPLGQGGRGVADDQMLERKLGALEDVLDDDDPPKKWVRFVEAFSEGTNVKAQRETRFTTFLEAVSKPS